jgi:hypothetical protein
MSVKNDPRIRKMVRERGMIIPSPKAKCAKE